MTGEHVLFEEDIIMKNNSSIKTVVAVGIGAALFFVLGRFVAIPSPVPNTNISLQSCTDRPVMGRKPVVELGNHFRIRWCGYRPVCQETERSGRRIR